MFSSAHLFVPPWMLPVLAFLPGEPSKHPIDPSASSLGWMGLLHFCAKPAGLEAQDGADCWPPGGLYAWPHKCYASETAERALSRVWHTCCPLLRITSILEGGGEDITRHLPRVGSYSQMNRLVRNLTTIAMEEKEQRQTWALAGVPVLQRTHSMFPWQPAQLTCDHFHALSDLKLGCCLNKLICILLVTGIKPNQYIVKLPTRSL